MKTLLYKIFSGILVSIYLCSTAVPGAVFAMPAQISKEEFAAAKQEVSQALFEDRKAVSLLIASQVQYLDLVVDETRGVLYGADKTGNKIDVIRMADLAVTTSYLLVSGALPTGIDLSPDGNELAVAQSGLSRVKFINLVDGAMSETPAALSGSSTKVTDVLYGRAGVLYALSSNGLHVINTTLVPHVEDAAQFIPDNSSAYSEGFGAISSDKNTLYYVTGTCCTGYNRLSKFDISSGLAKPVESNYTYVYGSGSRTNIRLSLIDANTLLTSFGTIYDTSTFAPVARNGQVASPAIALSSRDFYVTFFDNTSTPDVLYFLDRQSSYKISSLAVVIGTPGALAATNDGSTLFVSSTGGMTKFEIGITSPGAPISLPQSLKQYRDFAFDMPRSVLYGTDVSNRIDVIDQNTGNVLNSYLLPNGANPIGVDLSPDGNELAIALNGLEKILFINPETGAKIAEATPQLTKNIHYTNLPYDVIYGRTGRLYSDGNPSSGGVDYIHVFDTVTHTWLAKSSHSVRTGAEMAVTADKRYLYANEGFSPNNIDVFDVQTDTITKLYEGPHGSVSAAKFTILPDGSKVFTSGGQAWSGDMQEQLGTLEGGSGKLIELISGLNLVALTASVTNGDVIRFLSPTDYRLLSTYDSVTNGNITEMEIAPDGSRLFMNINNGIKILELDSSLPMSITALSGSAQSVQVLTPFQDPLKVKVWDIFGNPVPNAVVTFQAPSSGASVTFADTNLNTMSVITDVNGIAISSIFSANTVGGSYSVQATVQDLDSSVSFQLTNIAAVNCTLANGTGSATLFQPYIQFRCGKGAGGVASGDFNHDGRKDVALSTGDDLLLIYLQDVNGNLSLQPRAYASSGSSAMGVGDFNHDGRDDIVMPGGNMIHVFLQKNDGTFPYPVTYPTGSSAGTLTVGDVNNDGLADVVVSVGSNLIGVFTQKQGGTLNPIITYPSLGISEMAIGDVNGDGLNDVVSMNGQNSNQLQIFIQNNNNTLNAYFSKGLTSCSFSCSGGGMGIGDTTGDGRADIVMSYGGNRPSSFVAVFAQDANGDLQAPISYPSYDIPSPVEIADMNSDNLSDMITLHSGWQRGGVYLQQSNGTPGVESLYFIPYVSWYGAQGLKVGDVNADGFPDLLIADGQGLVVLYRNPNINATPTPTITHTPTATPPYSYNPLYLSLTGNQTIGGIASADEDILRFDGANWSLFFDGSDVGVGGSDLFGFSFLDADSLLMSFNTTLTLNGMSVTPRDVLRFDATSLGSTTAGTFSMYINGIDVGLDVAAENIDSVSLLPDERVLISTTGNPVVAGVTGGRDEDILAFTPTSLGNNTSGTWSLYFDGSDVGLGETSGEDVDALDVTSNGNIYLSTTGDFAAHGIVGADEDVLVCAPTSVGNVTSCNYLPALYFDGSTWGLTTNDVDAFNFLASSSIPTATPTNIPGTPTNTPTRTPTTTTTTHTPVITFMPATPTFTFTPTRTPTAFITYTPSPTFTRTSTPTRTNTPTTSPVLADLTITSMRIELQNTSCLMPGDPLGVRVWVQNTGQAAAGNFVVNVNSVDQTVNGLGIGETKAVFFAGAGNPVTAVVDSTGVVAESNENNNTRSETLPVPTPPAPCATNTPTSVASFTPTFTSTPNPSDLIFLDGFESGNLSAWIANTNDSGDLSANPSAALIGAHGLQAVIDDANTIYVTDDTPNAEPRYRARFYFDPNSLIMASNDAHFIFKGFAGTATDVFQVELRNTSGLYQIRGKVVNDSSAFIVTNWFTIGDASHFIEVDWQAATGSGTNNGSLTLWIDGMQQANLTGIDNDTWRVDRVRLGALAGMDAGTSGAYYFDAFESHRQTYIGP